MRAPLTSVPIIWRSVKQTSRTLRVGDGHTNQPFIRARPMLDEYTATGTRTVLVRSRLSQLEPFAESVFVLRFVPCTYSHLPAAFFYVSLFLGPI